MESLANARTRPDTSCVAAARGSPSDAPGASRPHQSLAAPHPAPTEGQRLFGRTQIQASGARRGSLGKRAMLQPSIPRLAKRASRVYVGGGRRASLPDANARAFMCARWRVDRGSEARSLERRGLRGLLAAARRAEPTRRDGGGPSPDRGIREFGGFPDVSARTGVRAQPRHRVDQRHHRADRDDPTLRSDEGEAASRSSDHRSQRTLVVSGGPSGARRGLGWRPTQVRG